MRTAAFIGLALIMSAIAWAGSYEKNDLPCVQEICIGDGLPELARVKWDRAKNQISLPDRPDYAGSRPVEPQELSELKKVFRGKVDAAAPYLRIRAFDQKAIALLEGVTASCGLRDMGGTFTSASGHPTTVTIGLLPDARNTSLQRWTVIGITRVYPAATSTLQKSEIKEELTERYGRFKNRGKVPQAEKAVFKIVNHNFGRQIGFYLLYQPLPGAERYRLHPACGGTDRISID